MVSCPGLNMYGACLELMIAFGELQHSTSGYLVKENDNGKPIQASWIPECPVPIEKLFAMLERSFSGVEAQPLTRTKQGGNPCSED